MNLNAQISLQDLVVGRTATMAVSVMGPVGNESDEGLSAPTHTSLGSGHLTKNMSSVAGDLRMEMTQLVALIEASSKKLVTTSRNRVPSLPGRP
jgi:hypothetical protein